MNKKVVSIILIIILGIFLIPFIVKLPAPFKFMDMTNAGDIGSFIGGITTPFISGLAAVLVYLAFLEQNKANNLLKAEIQNEQKKELERIERLRSLLIFDLENKILPSLNDIEKEMKNLLDNQNKNKFSTYNYHVEFNSKIFKSISPYDLNVIFKTKEELLNIIRIYNRVDFLRSKIPINLSYKYKTDEDSLFLIHLNSEQKKRVIDNHNTKKRIETQAALNKPIYITKKMINDFLKKEQSVIN